MIEPTWKLLIRASWWPWIVLLGLLMYIVAAIDTVPKQNQKHLQSIEQRINEIEAMREERALQYQRDREALEKRLEKQKP